MRVTCPWSCLPVSAVDVSDSRLCALTDWLGGRLDGFTLEPASADASFRRYFRVYHGAGSLIAMDAPPPAED